jgi:hypothetical protein
MKTPDNRCWGSGVCIINDAGECWCGQVWNGEKMVAPTLNHKVAPTPDSEQKSTQQNQSEE